MSLMPVLWIIERAREAGLILIGTFWVQAKQTACVCVHMTHLTCEGGACHLHNSIGAGAWHSYTSTDTADSLMPLFAMHVIGIVTQALTQADSHSCHSLQRRNSA